MTVRLAATSLAGLLTPSLPSLNPKPIPPQVLETCCRPHTGCGPLVQSTGTAAAPASTAAGTRPLPAGHGYYGSPPIGSASSAPAASAGVPTPSAAAVGDGRGASIGLKRSITGESPAGGMGAHRDSPVRGGGGGGGAGAGSSGSGHNVMGGGPGGSSSSGFCRDDGGGSGGGSGDRVVDDRLQRPMRKLVRERNGIRVLVGLLRYRRQVSMADAVRLRATLCLLGLAHDVQIAQVLEKMRITTTLSDTVRGGPVVDRWAGG